MTGETDTRELRDLLERERVVALVDHYVTTLDEPSSFDEQWARSLFTEDVRLEHEIAVLEGIEEVAAAHRLVMARWEHTLHFSTNHRIELDGEHAHLTARLMAIHVHPGENPPDPLIAANLLDADVVHTKNGWRFERFAPRTLWRTGQSPAETKADEN
jgi:SnoaL-like domain